MAGFRKRRKRGEVALLAPRGIIVEAEAIRSVKIPVRLGCGPMTGHPDKKRASALVCPRLRSDFAEEM